MSRKKVKTTSVPAHPIFDELTPVTCVAVTAFKVPGSLLAKSVSLTIINGVVIGVTDLTPAENTSNIAISKAVKDLWKIFRTQSTKTFFGET